MELKCINLKTNLITNELSAQWINFVNCPKRLEYLSPFLKRILYPRSSLPILDAALGIGCESILLNKCGFEVISNEISNDLIYVAREYAKNNQVQLNITNYNWLDFSIHFNKNQFGNIILLGNSICLMESLNEITTSIRNFYDILNFGGKLIIDERNFPYILSEKEKILNGNFRYSYKYLYCGKSIIGRPISINNNNVKFGYFKNDNFQIGELDMYPFRQNELKNILYKTGFSKVDTYSDFDKGYNSLADFYTYVATK